MGQSGISITNKTGYSMFWNSMWDNKISYNRYFKEDIFLEKFFSLGFGDNISNNFIKNNKLIFLKNNKNTYLHKICSDQKVLKNYLLNLNKIDYYSSKLWIFRYQNWVILYHFLFITSNNKNFVNLINNNSNFNDNSSNLIVFYKKSIDLNKINYSFLKKKLNSSIF